MQLAPPASYGEHYRRWSLSKLPIIPTTWHFEANPEKKEQLDILATLMGRDDVDGIINACDAGREGELIFRLVYGHCGCEKPILRLWVSSMEDSAIREGFANLKDGAAFENLYRAALCRAEADWLVGMNATRLFSCLYGATLAIGRVQSPTLAMVDARDEAIRSFVATPFYTPVIDTDSFCATGEKTEVRQEAEDICSACNGTDAVVVSVEEKEKAVAPPKLFDLTTLQRDANRLFGYTAQQTLDFAQALYEKKLATYPRTDSRFLTDDMQEKVPALVFAAADKLDFATVPAAIDCSRVIDGTKVSDHHAILPTVSACTADWDALAQGERDILTMLAVRLICAVDMVQRTRATTVTLECSTHRFAAKGTTVLDSGWKAVDGAYRTSLQRQAGDKTTEEDVLLPDIVEGQIFSAVSASLKEGKSTAPKHYTEDTLLAAMETADVKDFPDEAERKGLGTPATRATVMEKLIRSGFISRQKRNLVITERGKNLAAILPDEIRSAHLTAEWEQRLKQMERAETSEAEFIGGITALVEKLVAEHSEPVAAFASAFAAPPAEESVVGTCPRCGAQVAESDRGFFCALRTCRFALWKDSRFWAAKGKKLDRKTAAALLSDRRVFFPDLRSEKTGRTYGATIVLSDDSQRANYTLEFEKARKSA
jgi:DNA topoisomerase-3